MNLRIFGWSYGVTVVSLVIAFLYGSWEALILCAILGVLEISLSFDNAVVNATILDRMSDFWQTIFLTIGIFIAVFGMRLVFPLVIVAVTAGLSPIESLTLALEGGSAEDPGTYAYQLEQAYPQIAAFGGMFLLMLFLDWMFEDRDVKWLTWLERPLALIGKVERISVVIATVTLVLLSQYLADDAAVVLLAGALGLVTYLAVQGLGQFFEKAGQAQLEKVEADAEQSASSNGSGSNGSGSNGSGSTRSGGTGPTQLAKATGKAGFFLFLYLEVLDAAFSFDGVIGAFAITTDPILIALGLGLIGAMFVRSLTVFLVRKGTLADYIYLEHGAHWAIGALATILLLGIGVHVNEIVTGLIGVAFIGAALLSSIRRNRKVAAEGGEVQKTPDELAEERTDVSFS
ncbi:MAG: DUF475 domain-containing protein [Pseudonocardia sp.]|nr:DUF475 domain-containing protein [Pseudonocardia sp.]